MRKMLGFLTGARSFDWLIRRIQAFIPRFWGLSLHLVSFVLIRSLDYVASNDTKNLKMSFSVDCNLKAYMTTAFDGRISLANLICVNTNGGLHEASTLGEYMARIWPTTGVRFLEILQQWTDNFDEGKKSYLTSFVSNGEVSIDSSDSSFEVSVTGLPFLMWEIGEQLAWLGSVC